MSQPGFISNIWYFGRSLHIKYSLTSVTLLLLVTACGTVEKVSQNEIKTRYANLSPQQALQKTIQRFEQATNQQYDYYSPQNWKLASEALIKARELAKVNPEDHKIFKKVFLSERRIDSAQYIKDRELKEFADLFEYKKILQRNKAPSSFKAEYGKEAKKLAALLQDYESVTLGLNPEVENIRTVNINANKLLNSMRALNVKVVKHNHLSNHINKLKQLEEREAKVIAPISFKEAEIALKQANEFIENNVHDKEGVEKIAEKFIFSVSHLNHVLDEIITLSKKDVKQLEKVILNQEMHLLKIGKALNGLDVRNLPLASQAESVIKTANNVLDYHAEKSNMIVELSEKNLMLENQLKNAPKVDESANAKLKGKIKLLEMDIQALEKEHEKLKEDLFALQQKNIDLAIQNAKLLSKVEDKHGNVDSKTRGNLSENRSFIKSSRQIHIPKSADREQANLRN